MSSQPKWKNRRLAARVLRVLERTKDLDPTLAAYEFHLAPAATAFIRTYDRLRVLSKRRATEVAEGKAAVDELARTTRSWAGQVHALGAIKNFQLSDYVDSPDVPDDVISDANSLLELLAEHNEVNPDSVPYLAALTEDLQAKIEVARKEWTEAEVAGGAYQVVVDENRKAESILNAQLIAFRRSLANILGTSHRDYQTLRARRVSRQDPIDGTDPELELDEQGASVPPPATTDTGDDSATPLTEGEELDQAQPLADAG